MLNLYAGFEPNSALQELVPSDYSEPFNEKMKLKASSQRNSYINFAI